MTVDMPSTTTAPWTRVNVSTRPAFLSDLRTHLTHGRGFSIATLNLDHAVKLRRDPNFRAAYDAHTHVTADGRPIVWLSALAGQSVDLITGSDLVDPIVALCAETGAPVALLGSTDDILTGAAGALMQRHAGLDVVACLAPPMGFEPDSEGGAAMVLALRESGAQVCLLALGAPKQELFAATASKSLPQMGFVSIGAGLDFVVGAQKRAPGLVRALALEWLWRLMANPGRLARRYGQCFAILPDLTRRAISMRLQRPAEKPD